MRKTCHGCQHLGLNHNKQMALAYCKDTELVIPHKSERNGDKWELTYWRVPLSCPLPDDEVLKSEEQVQPKEWARDNVSVL